MKKLILLTCLLSNAAYAVTDFLEIGDKDFKKEKQHESKWLVKLGFDLIQYPTSLPEFEGKHDSVETGEVRNTYGSSLGVARDFNIGSGFSTTLGLSGFYHRDHDKDIGKGAEDIDIDFSETRTSQRIHGGELSISLNYLFENKHVNIQPFLELSGGVGESQVEKEYTRDELPSIETNGTEDYDVVQDESFNYTKIGFGLNFISRYGIVSYVKASMMSLTKTDRETEGESNVFGSAVIKDESSKENGINENESVMSASAGIGYYF
jgi:hypothetical protein